ncbi:hypothetical protein DB346_12095 [Verrucomicrobia bacterium LW23]|nr:hypothetical protein DB346_12095 [Verrucomicrobia bacterium LW23]
MKLTFGTAFLEGYNQLRHLDMRDPVTLENNKPIKMHSRETWYHRPKEEVIKNKETTRDFLDKIKMNYGSKIARTIESHLRLQLEDGERLTYGTICNMVKEADAMAMRSIGTPKAPAADRPFTDEELAHIIAKRMPVGLAIQFTRANKSVLNWQGFTRPAPQPPAGTDALPHKILASETDSNG